MGVASEEAINQFKALIDQVEEPLKGIFKNVHQGDTVEFLEKFLQAREGNVTKAHKMLVDCLQWRLENEIDKILAKPIIPANLYKEVRDSQPIGLSGYSKEHHPIIAIGAGLSTYDKATIRYYVQSHIQINEYRDPVFAIGAGLSTFEKASSKFPQALLHQSEVDLQYVEDVMDILERQPNKVRQIDPIYATEGGYTSSISSCRGSSGYASSAMFVKESSRVQGSEGTPGVDVHDPDSAFYDNWNDSRNEPGSGHLSSSALYENDPFCEPVSVHSRSSAFYDGWSDVYEPVSRRFSSLARKGSAIFFGVALLSLMFSPWFYHGQNGDFNGSWQTYQSRFYDDFLTEKGFLGASSVLTKEGTLLPMLNLGLYHGQNGAYEKQKGVVPLCMKPILAHTCSAVAAAALSARNNKDSYPLNSFATTSFSGGGLFGFGGWFNNRGNSSEEDTNTSQSGDTMGSSPSNFVPPYQANPSKPSGSIHCNYQPAMEAVRQFGSKMAVTTASVFVADKLAEWSRLKAITTTPPPLPPPPSLSPPPPPPAPPAARTSFQVQVGFLNFGNGSSY